MAIYITVDGGTTNTRIRFVQNNTVTAQAALPVGARICAQDCAAYRTQLINVITDLLAFNGISQSQVCALLASGMLTSELGLCPLPHIDAPAGVFELHRAMHRADAFPLSFPCYFMPGVRILGDSPLESDVMRGEECEFFGLFDQMEREAVCVLPGSHTKHIYADAQGRISTFQTFLTGELLDALCRHTVLASSLSALPDALDRDALLLGYDHAVQHGLNRVLFQGRIRAALFAQEQIPLFSYLLGAVLQADVDALHACERPVYIGGRAQLRHAFYTLLKERCACRVTALDEQSCALAATRGIVRIFEYQGAV